MVSPAQYEAVGKSWAEFGKKPSGTGPFKITRVVPGQYIEMVRNDDYWDKDRIPKLDKLVVSPMAEATTRIAALRSGQVDWIEVPAPDSIPSLKQAGYTVTLWPYPHTWPYCLNTEPGSPFSDVRVRQARQLRDRPGGPVQLLNGIAKPAVGLYPPGHPLFGNPTQKYGHDPAKAKALLTEAGYGPGKPCKAKIMISTSGSGQMLPIPMNEFLQQNFAAVGMEIDFDVVEWGTMLVAIRSDPESAAVARRAGHQHQPEFGRSLDDVPLLREGQFFPDQLQLGPLGQPDGDRDAETGAGQLRSRRNKPSCWPTRTARSWMTPPGCSSCTTSTRAPCRRRSRASCRCKAGSSTSPRSRWPNPRHGSALGIAHRVPTPA